MLPDNLVHLLGENRLTEKGLLVLGEEIGFAADGELVRSALKEQGIVVADENAVPEGSAVAAIPLEYARSRGIVPLAFGSDGSLTIAMCDPTDYGIIQQLQTVLGCPVHATAASRAQVEDWTSAAYAGRKSAGGLQKAIEGVRGTLSPAARLVDELIQEAAHRGVSDIHVEPFERELLVRFRRDGILQIVRRLAPRIAPEVCSRIKVMASMDIAERRRPQDGRIRYAISGRFLDIRVSALPTEYGQKMVLRLLDTSHVEPDLALLGMLDDQRSLVEKQIAQPHGMLLLTGPTGSGKTTTLYALLQSLRSPEINISTVEDPIEYRMDGIAQTAVHSQIGLTFAGALRTLLRQDPDVIMVGEIRDSETAELAVRAALTGHLVLSTLHTNDAASAPARLIDMGVEPYLLSSALRCVVAQRLVRKLCGKCHGSVQGQKCSVCNGTGYQGRMGIYEVMPVTEEISTLIHRCAPASEIRALAEEHGMRSLRKDGILKIAKKATTQAEVDRETLT